VLGALTAGGLVIPQDVSEILFETEVGFGGLNRSEFHRANLA
jgi:hypothetical protein